MDPAARGESSAIGRSRQRDKTHQNPCEIMTYRPRTHFLSQKHSSEACSQTNFCPKTRSFCSMLQENHSQPNKARTIGNYEKTGKSTSIKAPGLCCKSPAYATHFLVKQFSPGTQSAVHMQDQISWAVVGKCKPCAFASQNSWRQELVWLSLLIFLPPWGFFFR